MATKKASPAQIAARKLFAARAKAGEFAKGAKKTRGPMSRVDAAEAHLRIAKKHAARKTNPVKDPAFNVSWVSGMAGTRKNSSETTKARAVRMALDLYGEGARNITVTQFKKGIGAAAIEWQKARRNNPSEREMGGSRERPNYRVEVTHKSSPDYFFLSESGAVAEAKKLARLDAVGNVYLNMSKRGAFKWQLIYWFDSTGVYPAGSHGQSNTRLSNPIPNALTTYPKNGFRERIGLYRVLAEKKNGEFEEVATFHNKTQAVEYAHAFSKAHFRVTSVHDSK